MRIFVPLGLLIAMSLGCESSKDPSGGSGTDPGSDFLDEFAVMLCDLTAQCCAPHGYATPNDCVATMRSQLHRELDKDIDAGITHFDTQAADQCMAAYRGLAPSCPNLFSGIEVCKTVFYGSKDAGCGGGCAPSDAGVASCLTYSSTAADGAVSGGQMCQVIATVGPGEVCDGYGRMAFERRCDSVKNSGCVTGAAAVGTCSTPKPLGAKCTSPNTTECVPEAICTAEVCVARVAVGGACTDLECVPGAYCDATAHQCKPVSRWKKLCSGDFD